MTPLQVSEKLSQLRKDLISLSSIQIGMSNYKDVMRKYQQLVLGLIECMKELSVSVNELSAVQSSIERELNEGDS